MSEKLDALDKRILNELQRDASRTMEALAECVSTTPATCHRRYQRLKKDGIIQKTIAVADPSLSSQALTVIFGLVLSSQAPDDQLQVKKELTAHDNIKMAWMTTGDFDYIIVAAFPDARAFRDFVDVDLIMISNIRNFRSFISLSELKLDVSREFI